MRPRFPSPKSQLPPCPLIWTYVSVCYLFTCTDKYHPIHPPPAAHRSIHHGQLGAGGRWSRLPAAGPPAGLRSRALSRRRRCARDGDRGQLHQVHGHRRVPAGGRRRVRTRRQVGREGRRRARRRQRLLPRRRHGRVREVHAGDDDPAAHGRAVLRQGHRELRRLLEGRRRVHGRRGRRRRQVQGRLQGRDLPTRRVHPLHSLPGRRPHRRVLQGLVGAGVRRRGDREQAALRGRARVHYQRARGLAGREAQPGDEGRRATQGGRTRRRAGFSVNGPCGGCCPW